MKPEVRRVAILGASGHIGKGLAHALWRRDDLELFLLARSPEKVSAFLDAAGVDPERVRVLPLSDFPSHAYHTVINCVGIGTPGRLERELGAVFDLTQRFDDLVLDYLKKETGTLYVNMSSGAAYGTDFSAPPGEETQARFNANRLDPAEFYGIAKLNCEARHRALGAYNIVDLRVFGYFSRFIDLDEKFLLSEMASCMLGDTIFSTGPGDIWRDFVTPDDLAALILCLMRQGRINDVFDVYSAAPVSKFQLVEHFAAAGMLRYRIDGGHLPCEVTGAKSRYYSENRRAGSLGYRPRFTSLEGVAHEVEALLRRPSQTNSQKGNV